MTVTAVLTAPARLLVMLEAAAVAPVVLAALARLSVLPMTADRVAAVLTAAARFWAFTGAPLAVTAVLAETARLACLLIAAARAATAWAVVARLNPRETFADVAADVETEPLIAKPRVIWAIVPTEAAPPTVRVLVSAADAVVLVTSLTATARLAARVSVELTPAVQLVDAASS